MRWRQNAKTDSDIQRKKNLIESSRIFLLSFKYAYSHSSLSKRYVLSICFSLAPNVMNEISSPWIISFFYLCWNMVTRYCNAAANTYSASIVGIPIEYRTRIWIPFKWMTNWQSSDLLRIIIIFSFSEWNFYISCSKKWHSLQQQCHLSICYFRFFFCRNLL